MPLPRCRRPPLYPGSRAAGLQRRLAGRPVGIRGRQCVAAELSMSAGPLARRQLQLSCPMPPQPSSGRAARRRGGTGAPDVLCPPARVQRRPVGPAANTDESGPARSMTKATHFPQLSWRVADLAFIARSPRPHCADEIEAFPSGRRRRLFVVTGADASAAGGSAARRCRRACVVFV